MRFIILALIAATGFVIAPAQARDSFEPQQAARSAARDYIAPLTSPDSRRVRVRVRYCRERGLWHGCRVRITGATHCNGVLRVQVHGDTYAAWTPRMRCR